MQFDTVTVSLVALLAGLIGYVVGALRVAWAAPEAATPIRPLRRRERDDLIALLADGDTVEAIRLLREVTGADLASAHSEIERLRQELDAPPRRLS